MDLTHRTSSTLGLILLLAALFALSRLLGGSSNLPSPTEDELSFAEQRAAVRAGQTDTIIVSHSTVTDADLATLSEMSMLRILNLPHSEISNAGIRHLVNLPNLELLRFGSPQVNDEGMAVIAKLPALRWLHLINVPITDAGLEHLAGAKRLESLYIDGSQVTDDGISRLIERRPEIHFHKDQRHHDSDPQQDDHDHR